MIVGQQHTRTLRRAHVAARGFDHGAINKPPILLKNNRNQVETHVSFFHALHPALERSNLPGMPTKAKPVSKSAQKPPKSKAASLVVSGSYPARPTGRGGK